MRIGALWIHRLEQWDYNCWPVVCAHWKRPNVTKRIFCLWAGGLQIGKRLWLWRPKTESGSHPVGEPPTPEQEETQ